MTASKAPIYRQGDVALVTVAEIPADAKLLESDTIRGIVLAEGEATGHAHRIFGPFARHANLYRTETDQRYLRVTAGVQLYHEEHKTRCHVCPELPLALATHYDGTAEREHARYTCEVHHTQRAIMLDIPGNTYLPPGFYHRTLDADYVPGELPRNVAD